MPASALIAHVREAEYLVADLRRRHDPSAGEGVPAHITVLVPFKEPTSLTSEDVAVLEHIFLAQPSFAFTLGEVGRWPETTFLVPSESRNFVSLTNDVAHAFPAYPPYEGRYDRVVPHLTVADGTTQGAELAELELRQLLEARGPIEAKCSEIELIENTSGTWRIMHVFRLADGQR